MQLGNPTLLLISILVILAILGGLFLFFVRSRKLGGGGASSNRQIYIGNLPYKTTEKELYDQFAQYGKIESVRIVKDHRTSRSKGYAFITYVNMRDAKKSLVNHGKKLSGRSLVVYIAKPRDET